MHSNTHPLLSKLCALLLASMVSTAYSQHQNPMTFSAQATAYKQNTPVYTAKHDLDFEKKSGEVIYYDMEKNVLAVKQMDFSKDIYCPVFDISFIRHRTQYGIQDKQGKLIMYKNDENKELPMQKASQDKPMICDGGFDYFIKNNLFNEENTKRPFYFSLPNSQISLEMIIETLPASKAPEAVTNTAQQFCNCEEDMRYFVIKPGNWLVSLLAKPVILGYQESTTRLVVFSGQSNLIDSKGNSDEVVIGYSYPVTSKADH